VFLPPDLLDGYLQELSKTVFADGQAGQPALRLAGLPGLSAKTSGRGEPVSSRFSLGRGAECIAVYEFPTSP
jgi:hypothetical protein